MTHLDPHLNPNQSEIDELNRRIQITRWRVRNDKKLSKKQIEELMEMNRKRIQEVKALKGIPNMTGMIGPGITGAISESYTPTQFFSGGGRVKYYPMGGLIPYRSGGGSIFKPLGTDTVPAMLSPGEFVVRKYAVDNFGVDRLKAINSGTYSGESVYNYSVSVNVKSDANPDQIARSVMGQIKQIDSQRIRGNRF